MQPDSSQTFFSTVNLSSIIPKSVMLLLLFVVYSHISIYIGPIFLPILIFTLLATCLIKLYRADTIIPANPVNKYIYIFFAAVLISCLFTNDWSRAIYDLTIFLKSFLLFVLLLLLADNKKTLFAFIKIIVIATLIAALIALYEYRTTSIQMLLFSGRTGGIHSDPNFFASILVSIAPLSMMLTKVESNKSMKLFWGIATAILFFSIIPTFSRGGIIAFVVIAVLILWQERRNKYIFIIALISLLAFIIAAPFDFWVRVVSITQSQGDFSIMHRSLLLKNGFRIFLENPIIGVGMGDYIYTISKYINRPMVAHNMYLHVLAETGLIGGISFFCILGSIFSNVKITENNRNSAVYIRISLIGLFITAFFLSVHFHFWIWILLGISTVYGGLKEC
jgi:O-antigen ligase